MKSKAIAAATKIPLRNQFNTFTIFNFNTLIIFSINFLTPLIHLTC